MEKIRHVTSLDELEQLILAEIEYNHKINYDIIKALKAKLLTVIDTASKLEICHTQVKKALHFLQTELTYINLDEVADTIEARDQTLLKLLHLLYQAERITSFKAWTLRFFSRSPSECYRAVAPIFSEMRETLRQHSTLLPEILVPLNQILYPLTPSACQTVDKYTKDHSKLAL